MNRAIPGRTFFVAAYAILAIGFLTIHFTRVENYSTVVGDMALKGRSSVGTAIAPPQIRRLEINAAGLEILLRKSDKAALITDDGIRHPLDVLSWSQDEQSISVELSNGTGIILERDTHGNSTSLTPVVPVTVPPVRSLEIPFRPARNTRITAPADRPGVLSLTVGEQEFVAELPSDSTWDAESGRLNLVVLDKASPVLSISDDQRGGGLGVEEWYARGTAPSETLYTQKLEEWSEKVREGWDARYDPRSGLWRNADGDAEWNDRLAAALLADSVDRGQLPATLQSVTSIAGNAPQSIGWLPSPYLGNIVNQTRVHAEGLINTARALAGSVESASPDLDSADILRKLTDGGESAAAAQLMALMRTAPLPDASNQDILNRIAVMQEGRLLELDNAGDQERRKGYFDSYIIPRIFWVKDGLWLVKEDGSVDTLQNIRAGRYLIREAQWNNDGVYQAVGRQLIISSLEYAGDGGSIPGTILFEASGEVLTEGRVMAEEFFADLTEPAAYPRHISLARELGTGSWALTGAQRFTLRSTPRETTVALDFPAGSIHHIAIRGIKPFNVLFMNGIRWNGDPNFQRYYAGWFYDAATETLFIKIRHRVNTETIRILYYDPDAPAEPGPGSPGGSGETGEGGAEAG